MFGALAVPGPARADDPVLHEYVAPPRRERIVDGDKPRAGDDKAARNPSAIRQDQKIIPSPSTSQPPMPREIMADRETQAHPDYATHADGTLHYVEAFNPSIVPFKRMSALDQVRADYTIEVGTKALERIPVGGQSTPERDLFWGSFAVELPAGGGDVPMPSVAPDMRILSYEVKPRARLLFSKDGADNYFVRAEGGGSGTHRIVMLVDAPVVYFAPQVPAGLRLGEIAAKRPLAPLPQRVKSSANRVLARIGVTPEMTADRVIGRLVEYFRNFGPGEPPSRSGDIYLDLALSQTGVCRHRAFAFLVTALAAGIPTRYVTNEAHAFVEIWVPGPGWLRVDLGGAALELDVDNASDKTLYRPRGDDPFPKPRAYTENYTTLRGTVNGLSARQLAEGRGVAAPAVDGRYEAGSDPRSTEPVIPPAQPLPRPAAASGKKPLSLFVDKVDGAGFRGETVTISGHAGGQSGTPAGLRIELFLAPAGGNREGARIIGQAVTDASGAFTLTTDLPLDLSLGRYEVYALTDGDSTYGPALSD